MRRTLDTRQTLTGIDGVVTVDIFSLVPVGSPLSPGQLGDVFQYGDAQQSPSQQEEVLDITNLNCFILMLDLFITQVSCMRVKL